MTARRDFIKKTALAGILPMILPYENIMSKSEIRDELDICIFSKHLQFLEYEAVGAKAVEMGFSGVDLTVRPNGHVLPENVETGLPQALEAIRRGGSRCELITTAVENVENNQDKVVLETAADLGIKYYRCNWFKYQDNQPMEDSLVQYAEQIKALSLFNQRLGLVGCYQNHAGMLVGSSVWEIIQLLEKANQDHFGLQYDIRHATVEGGLSWINGLRLVKPHIKTLVLKDFKWSLLKGKWTLENTPIGEGMVDFHTYFKWLKQNKIDVPISLHLEYPLGGAEHGSDKLTVDEKIVYDAMKRDLKMTQKIWKES